MDTRVQLTGERVRELCAPVCAVSKADEVAVDRNGMDAVVHGPVARRTRPLGRVRAVRGAYRLIEAGLPSALLEVRVEIT